MSRIQTTFSAATAIAALLSCGPKTPPDPPPPPPDETVDVAVDADTQPEQTPPPEADALTVDEASMETVANVEKDTGEEVIVLAQSAKPGKVTFRHHDHMGRASCQDCHHEMQDVSGKASACGSCHGSNPDVALGLEDAFHTQCKGCHTAQKKGPVDKCAACHKKK
jgi:hypothetical protein